MKAFRLHLKHGLSAEKYERLAARLGISRKAMTPVRGGGRNLVVAIDLRTGKRETAEFFAEKRIWSPKRRLAGPKPVRVQVVRIDNVTEGVPV